MPDILLDDQPFEIAIVSLIPAFGLIKRKIKVKIYEQAQNFREIGAGVAFTANAIQCMSMIDPQTVDALKRIGSSNGDPDKPTDYLQWPGGYKPGPRDSERESVLFKLYVGHRGEGPQKCYEDIKTRSRKI